MSPRLLQFVFALAITGCASVRIESASGDVQIEHRWGVLGVVVDRSAPGYVAEVRSLGITSTPIGWSAGITQQNWASLGPECRLAIWVSEAEHLEAAKRLQASTNGVCVVSPHNH